MPGACECVCEGKALAPRSVLKRALALPPAAAPGYAAALFAMEPAGAPAPIPALPDDQAPPPWKHSGKAYMWIGLMQSWYLGCQLTVSCWALDCAAWGRQACSLLPLLQQC